MATVEQLPFTDRFVRELPGDPRTDNQTRQVLGACYSRVEPTAVPAPELVALVPEVAALLELDPSPELAAVLGGNRVVPGMVPYAACYGGHQFGTWAGQLGDGRAITLGEVTNTAGEIWELQLKGAGPTPYSRRADGRAVLRSSLRELVCSEAMHHLGVPTTRALSLVTTGQPINRDLLYDGRPADEPGAVVCRVAPSFLRFGSYEIHTSRDDHQTLRALVDFTLARFYPGRSVAQFFHEVMQRTAWLLAEWMRVGFVHGVMNTDNMSILGLTIDYGPYGWLEPFDVEWTPNITDASGRRYRFGNQPAVAHWNLAQLARALAPIAELDALRASVDAFPAEFSALYHHTMLRKLGLSGRRATELEMKRGGLAPTLEPEMKRGGLAPTLEPEMKRGGLAPTLEPEMKRGGLAPTLEPEMKRGGLAPTLEPEMKRGGLAPTLEPEMKRGGLAPTLEPEMKRGGLAPTLEPEMKRGGLAPTVEDDALLTSLGELLVAVETDFTLFFRLLAAPSPSHATLRDAFYDPADRALLDAWLEAYLARVAIEGITEPERAERMTACNPLYVPRNYLVQEVIAVTEHGDRAALAELLDVLRHPYTAQPGRERFAAKRPEWARHKPGCSMLSCSS